MNMDVNCVLYDLETLTLFFLMTTQEAFVDSVNQDQTAQTCSLISDLHCPHFLSIRSRL